MAAKKIQKVTKIQMSLKPTDTGYKAELIRKTMTWPVAEVIAYAKENGVELKTDYVYTTRWSVNKKRKKGKKAAKVSRKKSPGTAIVKATSAVTVKAKKASRRPVPAQDGSNHMVSEKAMAKLILQLGTLRARELIDRTEASFTKSLGI